MTETEQAVIGISFGTGYACISIPGVNGGSPETIANEDGHRQIPAYVAFTGFEELFGTQAQLQAFRNPTGTISHFRQLLGQTTHDAIVKRHQKQWKVRITADNDKLPLYEVEYYESEESEEPTIQQHSVIQVTAKYLKKLKETAELVIGKSVKGCVISIPAHYSEKQKKALLEAAHVAGFSSAYSLHEPVAAVMAFNASVVKENNILDKQVLVLDLGAEAFNVSLISNHDGIYTIEESVEEENLGGQRFDEVLMEFAMDDFKKKSKIDISNNKRALFKLRKACETAKRALTRQDTAPCYVESLAEGIDYNGTILRGRFDILSEPLYTRCKHVVLNTLKNAHLTPKDVDQVLLVGGSSRLPKFQEAMKSLFPDIGNEFRTEVEPDEAIALGCAVQAGILIEEGVDLDVEFPEDAINAKHLSKTIGITSLNDEFVPVIPAGTPLPVRRSFTVPLTTGQSSVYLAISEIDEHQKTLVGEVALVDIPAVKNANVEVVFLIELDHLLNVTIKELVSGKSVNAILK